MANVPFLGEIKIFAGNFSIRDYAFCNGQLLAIAQHTNLFTLLGTTYGGDGVTTFALPDLRGRVPLNQGQGGGLTNRPIGESGGSESVTLLISQMPAHTHALAASSDTGNTTNPANNFWAAQPALAQYAAASTPAAEMKPAAISQAGGSQPHENTQPYIALNYLIALVGSFPT